MLLSDLALEFCQPFFAASTDINKTVIISDCQSAIETVSSLQYPSNFTKILCKTYERVKLLSNKQIEIEILWNVAHTGNMENELADKCAIAAADGAAESTFKDSTPFSCSEVKKSRISLNHGSDNGIETNRVVLFITKSSRFQQNKSNHPKTRLLTKDSTE